MLTSSSDKVVSVRLLTVVIFTVNIPFQGFKKITCAIINLLDMSTVVLT